MVKIIDEYKVIFENTEIGIIIYTDENEFVPMYEVEILDVGPYTKFVIEKIKEDLLREGILENDDVDSDYNSLKKLFVKKVRELIEYYLPVLDVSEKNRLITYIIQKSLDLGFVDILISDNNLEEITINGGKKEIMIYHRKYGWLKTNLKFFSDEEIQNIATRIAMENKKYFSNLNPLLDAHLRGGHRVNATMKPISTEGSTITIRRFSDNPWTVSDLITYGTSSPVVLALIWIAMEYEFSIIVSGGTGSGKTSFLNAISTFIPADQRIISIEDTREIRLPKYAHWVPMEARQANQEGKGEVSILDLIVNSLRMRPDRIIIGEIRRKKEAEVLFEAMRTGHSVYGTFHANTANETILRLSSAPIDIPKYTLSAIGLVCVQHRDRRTGKRFTLQVAEIDKNGNEKVVLQYDPKSKKHFFKNKPVELLNKLKEFQGISEEEFYSELKKRAFVLSYLSKFNINDVDKVGVIINKYYKNSNTLIESIHKEIRYLRSVSKSSNNKNGLRNDSQIIRNNGLDLSFKSGLK